MGSVTPSSSASPTISDEPTSRAAARGRHRRARAAPRPSRACPGRGTSSGTRSSGRWRARGRRSASTRASESTVPKASSALRQVGARQQPFELRRGEVGVGDEAGARSQDVGGQLAAALGGAPVLPDDRGRHRRARRRSQRTVVSRWFVIPIALELRGPTPAVRDSVLGGAEHARPDLLRVVLDPARLRKVLRELAVAAPRTRAPRRRRDRWCPSCPGRSRGSRARAATRPGRVPRRSRALSPTASSAAEARLRR